jgi:hypothetical protein
MRARVHRRLAAGLLHEAVILADRHRALIYPEISQLDHVSIKLTHPAAAPRPEQ